MLPEVLATLRPAASDLAHASQPARSAPVHAVPRHEALVSLQYLTSYEGMGVVRASCSGGGCACTPTEIDAHAPSSRKSTLSITTLSLTLSSSVRETDTGETDGTTPAGNSARRLQLNLMSVVAPEGAASDGAASASRACLLSLLLLNTTASGGHRFKLSRLIVEERVVPTEGTAAAACQRHGNSTKIRPERSHRKAAAALAKAAAAKAAAARAAAVAHAAAAKAVRAVAAAEAGDDFDEDKEEEAYDEQDTSLTAAAAAPRQQFAPWDPRTSTKYRQSIGIKLDDL